MRWCRIQLLGKIDRAGTRIERGQGQTKDRYIDHRHRFTQMTTTMMAMAESTVPPTDSSGMSHCRSNSLDFFDAMEVIYYDDILHQAAVEDSSATVAAAESSSAAAAASSSEEHEFSRDGLLEEEGNTRTNNFNERARNHRIQLHEMAQAQRRILEHNIRSRRAKLKQIMREPGIVMTMDKISFVCGVLTIMIIEAVLLLVPGKMATLYTALLIPLLLLRYIIYRADLQHYFMYDFCYYAQLMMMMHIYKYPNNIPLGKAMFSISNGPLLLAIVMWRNSLVFHSMDKMTSMFIHILPSLVTFCHRWEIHLVERNFPFYEGIDGTIITICNDFLWTPFCYYILWQTFYLIKTEVVSKEKLEYNTEIMTSLRWLTRKKDSASYKLLSVFGEHNQLPTFVLIQAVYTVATFLVVPLLWHSIWLHALYLVVIFVIALANGATYYFHVFAKRYIEEIGRRVSENTVENKAKS